LNKKLGVSAYNIHTGGGKIVLLAFLKSKTAEFSSITCFIDSRLNIEFENFSNVRFVKVKPSLFSRLKQEYFYKKASKNFDQFFFLGNLPPIFKLENKTVLFLQNRLLISPPYINKASLKAALRSFLELCWFNLFLKNADIVQTQTSTMLNIFKKNYIMKKCEIANYLDVEELTNFRNEFELQNLPKEKNSFIYICSQDSHKNLERLILAFSNVGAMKLNYTLYLNIPPNSYYCKLAKKNNVNLILITANERSEILKSIYCADFLIFPSYLESLGLPLIEAQALGTKILASNLDFVFEVCTPISTFDPFDIESITNSIVKNLKNSAS